MKILQLAYIYEDTNEINIQIATALGIVKGYENNKFKPENLITREEAATMLFRTYLVCDEIKKERVTEYEYEDKSKIASWAIESVMFMYELGIMQGTGENIFSPTEMYTREQSYTTFLRLLKKLYI